MTRGKLMALSAALAVAASASARTVENFNAGWEFARDGEAFAHVAVPHDWAIAGPFDVKHGGNVGSLPWKGRGTYRKSLVLAEKPKGRVFLEFDGVMARATVFVNGQPCGHGDYGYLGFVAEATPYLLAGTNTVTVKVDTLDHASRWYPGAGIYRDVRLVTTDKVHFDADALRIETDHVLTGKAKVSVSGAVESRLLADAEAKVTAVLRGPDGQVVDDADDEIEIDACGRGDFDLALKVRNPQLWKLEDGAKLYSLELRLAGDGFSDALVRRVGLREFRFDADRGFFLNGERVQLNGVDLHSDLGPLGMAFDVDAARRQLAVMRDMGANAIRMSHNPPAPQVLDLCDEMGLFVWDEAFDKWNATCGRGDIPLEEFVPRQLVKLVRRDRNHPSVFVWSIGNEISPGKATPPGQEDWAGPIALGTTAERCASFRRVVLEEDDTRPVAIGSCFPVASERGDYTALDLVGWNYREMYVGSHAKLPGQPVLYSESASALSEFGFYADTPPTNKTDFAFRTENVDSYDLNAAPWSDIPDREFARMERDTFCAGEFVWTGIDYLGEPTPYQPSAEKQYGYLPRSRSSYFGICDLCALPKDRFYLYRSHWNRKDFTLHLVPGHWNFPKKAGQNVPVFVYTSADEAELFVNGRSLGRRKKDPTAGVVDDNPANYYSVMPRYRLMWNDVPYAPGEVKAVAYGKDGRVYGEKVLRTAGAPTQIVLTPEPRYGNLCVVVVTLADRDGTFVPNDSRRISFAAEGCEIAAVGNSDPRSFESFKDVSGHSLAFGRAAVYLRLKPGRPAKLTATAGGLAAATVELGTP